ncbi:flavin oxidoreductase [Arthrobacter sp. HMWF013]|nr:flavin oxidoreductase [Arthrobacter sp. HMWF013]
MPDGAEPARHFRNVLGSYPTGVVAVTAPGEGGEPIAMVVGSFTSVSLDPPMVAFLADRGSGTFPKIKAAGHFVANVLASDQAGLCRSMAAKGAHRFRDVAWQPSEHGAPLLEGVVAWIECTMEQVVEAGDHVIAIGRVNDLRVVSEKLPLLFFRGTYGAFEAHTMRLEDRYLGWG